MNVDVKARWVEALRSGEYQQAKGALRRAEVTVGVYVQPARYCCLGVLCDLAVQDGVVAPWQQAADNRMGLWVGTYMEVGTLPEPVKDWAGLGSANPTVARPGLPSESLATVNDSGADFAAIAALIEGQL